MPNKVNASHILLKTEGEAFVALSEIRHGKSFEQVAKEKSLCPSKKRGGSLGWFTKGKMVPEFERPCFTGKKGDLLGPIKTQFGWHLIRIDETG